MKYNFLSEAEAEYLESIRFYEEQQAKLGLTLIHEFERLIDIIVERPLSWRQVNSSGIRCVSLTRFPYSVFYRVLDQEVQITAFAHHRRRPMYWLKRIQ